MIEESIGELSVPQLSACACDLLAHPIEKQNASKNRVAEKVAKREKSCEP